MFQKAGRIVALALTLTASGAWAASDLHDQIRAIAQEARGQVAVACSVPGASLDCSFNEHAHPPMQSVFKLPLALTALHLVEQGKFTLSQSVRFEASDRFEMPTVSPLQDRYQQANVDVPIEELARLSVVESDNVASEVLLKLVGGPSAVNEYIASMGVKGFHLQDGERALHRDSTLQYRNWFEPAGALQLLRLISDHSPLNREHTALLLRWMRETPRGNDRIPGQLPRGTRVMHKPGSAATKDGLTAAWNDIGLVSLPNGRTLAIGVFITDSTADDSTRDAVIARITKAVWDAAIHSRGHK